MGAKENKIPSDNLHNIFKEALEKPQDWGTISSKSITFDYEAQEKLPQWVKNKMNVNMLLADIERTFGIGCKKICQERYEQIHKHGRTVDLDVKQNTQGQLLYAARTLTMGVKSILPEIKKRPPTNWDEKSWVKICEKEYFEDRIVVSASLTAAEIDRLNADFNNATQIKP